MEHAYDEFNIQIGKRIKNYVYKENTQGNTWQNVQIYLRNSFMKSRQEKKDVQYMFYTG